MTTYKYITDTVVAVIDDDGISRMSGLVSIVPEGATIEPADPIPEPTPIDPVEKLRAFLAANPDVQEILG